MDYSDSTIAVSATVEEQAFSLPRRAVGPALRCQTNGLSAPVPRGYTNSGIALNVSKQCPTRALFSPAMTRVRAHQERLIHCLAIPFIICVLQSRSDSRIHAAILSVLDSGFEGNSSSSQVSSFLDPTGATTGKPADLLAAFGEGNYPATYNHFLASGLNEGRASSVNFDVGFCLNHYPDLIAASKSGLLSLKPVTIPDRYMNCAMRAERHPPNHWCPATVNFQTSQHKREKPNTQNPVVQIGSSCRLLMLPRARSTSAVRPAAPDTA